MFRTLYRFSFLLVVSLLFERCAQMSPLTGGKRDASPPVLISAKPENLSRHFSSGNIVFTFNEYVQVRDLSNQLLISPKLKNNPEVIAEGKRVKVMIDTSELKPNTTYRFYFGQAIADMNEGNPLSNFEYIFSTGNHIDSMSVKGHITDASTNAPLNNMLVGLYPESLKNDSLPYQTIPSYITHSDPSGAFIIDHLPADKFFAYAIDDNNKNLVFDQDAERIGFLNDGIQLPGDSLIGFKLFKQLTGKVFVKKTLSPYYGLVKIILNKSSRLSVRNYYPEDDKNLFVQQKGETSDTVLVFYKNLEDSLKLQLKYSEDSRSDSLMVALPRKNLKKKKFGFIHLNTVSGTVPVNTRLKFSFISWMDTSFIHLPSLRLRCTSDTSIVLGQLHFHWLNVREFELLDPLPPGRTYRIEMDTAVFKDVYGTVNDTCKFQFYQQSRKDLGKVTLKLSLNKKQSYLVQLLNEKDKVQKEEQVFLSLSSSNAKTIDFTEVPPGNYKVRIVSDNNGNSLWDTGNLFLKQQPEPVFIYPKLLKVISDWEIEEEIGLIDQN